MTEELEQLLKNLKLRRILEICDEQLRAADKDDISYSEFLTRLVRAQWQAKQEGALEWRIGRANLPERWTLETFPFARQPGVNRKQIRGFAELEFIARAENIIFTGATASLRGSAWFANPAVPKIRLAHSFPNYGAGTRPKRDSHCSERYRELLLKRGSDSLLAPEAIAETYYNLHLQQRSAWTLELDLRPWTEKF